MKAFLRTALTASILTLLPFVGAFAQANNLAGRTCVATLTGSGGDDYGVLLVKFNPSMPLGATHRYERGKKGYDEAMRAMTTGNLSGIDLSGFSPERPFTSVTTTSAGIRMSASFGVDYPLTPQGQYDWIGDSIPVTLKVSSSQVRMRCLANWQAASR